VTVTVHMHGNLRRFMPEGRDRAPLPVEPGTTVEALLTALGAAQDTWLVAVNGRAVARDHVLTADDVIDCFEPIAGG
jgi:sulfur carrier protein ThiS